VHEHAVRQRHTAQPKLLHEPRVPFGDGRTARDRADDAAVASRRGLVIGGRGGPGSRRFARRAGAQIVSTDEFWDGEAFDIPRL
jgi:hypothetical protein